MAKYDVLTWYSEVTYGKAYKVVEADSEEEAIGIAHEEVDGWHFKECGSTDFEFDYDETEASRV